MGKKQQPEALQLVEMLAAEKWQSSVTVVSSARENTASKRQAITPLKGGLYNWKGQPERLVYMGTRRYPGSQSTWHQFAKVEAPHMCWSEVLTSELAMIEETKDAQ